MKEPVLHRYENLLRTHKAKPNVLVHPSLLQAINIDLRNLRNESIIERRKKLLEVFEAENEKYEHEMRTKKDTHAVEEQPTMIERRLIQVENVSQMPLFMRKQNVFLQKLDDEIKMTRWNILAGRRRSLIEAFERDRKIYEKEMKALNKGPWYTLSCGYLCPPHIISEASLRR